MAGIGAARRKRQDVIRRRQEVRGRPVAGKPLERLVGPQEPNVAQLRIPAHVRQLGRVVRILAEVFVEVLAERPHRLQVEVVVVDLHALVTELLAEVARCPAPREIPAGERVRHDDRVVDAQIVALEALRRNRRYSFDVHVPSWNGATARPTGLRTGTANADPVKPPPAAPAPAWRVTRTLRIDAEAAEDPNSDVLSETGS